MDDRLASQWRPRRGRWAAVGSLVACLLAIGWWGWVPPNSVGPGCRLDKNAAWISVDWLSQPVNEPAVHELATNVSRRRIDYLYPFTTYLRSDGTFGPSFEHAAEWLATYRLFNGETVILAWIGIPLVREGLLGIEGSVDLAKASEREKIVQLCGRLVDEIGFDGIHLNVETVQSENPDYLTLLDEVRGRIGDRTLSVAASYWLPRAVNELPVLNGFKWDGDYYRAVAGRVDQVVTMTYDSGMPLPALYRLWLREEVAGIARSLTGSDVELLVGFSVSRERTPTHRPGAESLENGLAGLCASHSRSLDAEAMVEGVALYAAWEAEPSDWRRWEQWTAVPAE